MKPENKAALANWAWGRQSVDLLGQCKVIASVDEYGDGISVQILTVFPSMVLQQIRNTIAVRVIRPRGLEKGIRRDRPPR